MWLKYLEGAAYALRFVIGTHAINGGRVYGSRSYNKRAAEALRGVLPYCLHPSGSGDDAPLIWLNRDYKPLGVLPFSDHVEYADFPWMHVARDAPEIMPLLAECKQVIAFCDAPPIFYLYDDMTSPVLGKANAERLIGLMDLVFAACDKR